MTPKILLRLVFCYYSPYSPKPISQWILSRFFSFLFFCNGMIWVMASDFQKFFSDFWNMISSLEHDPLMFDSKAKLEVSRMACQRTMWFFSPSWCSMEKVEASSSVGTFIADIQALEIMHLKGLAYLSHFDVGRSKSVKGLWGQN